MKKIISIIMCILIISLTGVTAFAYDGCSCGIDPTIYVRGMGAELFTNYGTNEEKNIFFPETSTMIKPILKLLPSLTGLIFFDNYNSFYKQLVSSADDIFGALACDDDGNSVLPNVSSIDNEVASYHDKTYKYWFSYDWRMDVYDIADDLRDYIEEIKAATEHDKVAIQCESMGSNIIMSYIVKYGDESISSLIIRSGAFMGLTMMSSLFTKNVAAQPHAVVRYISNFLQGDTASMNLLHVMLGVAGEALVTPICNVINNLFAIKKDELYDDFIKRVFGNMPGFWAFVPDEYYTQAKQTMLDETKNAVLIEKIDRYHTLVRPNIKNIIQTLLDKGKNVAIISNYGLGDVPVTQGCLHQSDFLVDTKFSSLGATCAPLTQPFKSGYKQVDTSCNHNHVSCDLYIDASTCMFPEITWFVKGMVHTFFNDGYEEFTSWIAHNSTQVTVHDNPSYPQFMENFDAQNTIIPLQSPEKNFLTLVMCMLKYFGILIA